MSTGKVHEKGLAPEVMKPDYSQTRSISAVAMAGLSEFCQNYPSVEKEDRQEVFPGGHVRKNTHYSSSQC